MASEQSPDNIDALALERERLALERQRIEFEQQSRERELQLRSEELELRRTEQIRVQWWRNPLLVGVFAAVVGLLGNMLVTLISGINERAKAKREYRSALILEAIKTGNPDTAASTLKFFLDAHLLTDTDNTLTTYLAKREPGTGVSLPISTEQAGLQQTAPAQEIRKIPTKYPGIMAYITRFGTSGAFVALEITIKNTNTGTNKIEVRASLKDTELSDQQTGDSWKPVNTGGTLERYSVSLGASDESGGWLQFKILNPEKRVFLLKSALFDKPVEDLALGKPR